LKPIRLLEDLKISPLKNGQNAEIHANISIMGSGVSRNERARDKNCVMGHLSTYFLFEGIIFDSFHELALVSFFSFFTTA
jgi:hypothetical protein